MSQQQRLEDKIGTVTGLVSDAAHVTAGLTIYVDGDLHIRG